MTQAEPASRPARDPSSLLESPPMMQQLQFSLMQLVVLLLTAGTAVPASREDDSLYDLLVRRGKIGDGTGNPWFFGDVAVNGDRIAAVGHLPDATARREIDAGGLVVSPGFIDMHSNS